MGDGTRVSYNTMKLAVPTETQLFFVDYVFPGCCNLLVVSIVPKKVDFDNSASLFDAFVEEWAFGVPYSAIFTNVTHSLTLAL